MRWALVPHMHGVKSPPCVATLEMSENEGREDEGDGDYESLPPHVSLTTHMTAGAVAGVLEHTVMYPVDSVKRLQINKKCWCNDEILFASLTRMQSLQPDPKAQYSGVYQALKRIIQTEGLFRPLRGLNITMLGAGPAHALYFACYEQAKHSLSHTFQSKGNSHLANGLAGSIATVLHDAIMNPAEVVKQRMQMYNSPYRGLWDCVRTMTRTEGPGAFYRSYSTQLTMNIPFQAMHFITYELMQERLNPQRQYHPGSHVAAGALAGAVSAAVTTPLDVCKTLLNTQENTALDSVRVSGHLTGMANAFRTVYRLGGAAAFFKGVQARVIYQMPSTAIAWSVYEFFKYFMTQQQLEREASRGSR
ncbi:mitoferrin-1 isoform X3 [Gadus macrocephalus]|uniref:mitoferrin-1 isoform X3 n=1 Tax=Gadus macrocephalus TaxID=80720 RepID=UPI0028CB971D|nr:mitoferrin-1 isoform X3 [Gadus macrocephalus]